MAMLHTASFLLFAAVVCAQDAPRPAKDILRDFDRVVMPSLSDGSDAESGRRFRQAIQDGCRRKAELAAELQHGHPAHRRLPEVLAMRWAGLTNALGQADGVLTELTLLLGDEQLRDDVRAEARRALARARIVSDKCTNLQRVDAVTDLFDGDDVGYEFAAACLLDLIEMRVGDPETQRTLLDLAVERWPDKPYGGRPAKRWLHVLELLGKPLADELPAPQRQWFTEATVGDVEFTVVQVWTGWMESDGQSEDLADLLALRRDLGDRVRIVGLMNGDLDARLPAARKAGVDWPQTELPDPEPMVCPFGAPKVGFYFLLDRQRHVVGIAGRAALLKPRMLQVSEPAVR